VARPLCFDNIGDQLSPSTKEGSGRMTAKRLVGSNPLSLYVHQHSRAARSGAL